MLTLLFALLAVLAQPTHPPADFFAGLAWSAEVRSADFFGRVWICDPAEANDDANDYSGLDPLDDIPALRELALDPDNDYAEVCYAGLDGGGLVTGP